MLQILSTVACFQFTADQYQGAENTRQVDIMVEVLQGIATPVDLLVTPLEYDVFEPTPNFPVVPPLDPTRPNRARGVCAAHVTYMSSI